MTIHTVRAVLDLRTPVGKLRKSVNWSTFESRAMLSTSTSSEEAFEKFLDNAEIIINASKTDLKYIKAIWFYEHSWEEGCFPYKSITKNATPRILIVRTDDSNIDLIVTDL